MGIIFVREEVLSSSTTCQPFISGIIRSRRISRGSCSCAKCHVYLDEDSAPAFGEPTLEEQDLLEFLDGVQPCSRLACQLVLAPDVDTVTVTVPSSDA